MKAWRIPIAVAAAALAAFAYYQMIYYPSTPQYAVGAAIEARKSRSYQKLYDLVDVPTALRVLVPGPEALATLDRTLGRAMPQVRSYHFKDVSILGDEATVKTSVTVDSLEGLRTDTADVSLVHRDGKWKIDGGWLMKELSARGLKGALAGAIF